MKYLKSFINKKPWEMEFGELVTFIEENGLTETLIWGELPEAV